MSRDLSGKTLSGYRFGDVLAKGAQSTVYAAYQGDGDRAVAVKVFLSELPKDKIAAGRIVADVERAARVSHKNLVPVIEVGSLEWKGKRHLFVAMERLHGESLKARLQSQPGHSLPLHVALQIASAVGGALQALHGADLVHRGLNPGAVFLSPPTDAERQADLEAEDHIYLLDAGQSALFEGLNPSSNGKRPKPSDDIRGLAALVSEMLGGVPQTAAQGSEALLPLRFRNRKIPARLDAVLRLVLSSKLGTDKQDPYPSVSAFVAALFGDATNIPTMAAWSSDGRAMVQPTRNRSGLMWAAILSVVGGASFGVGYWLYQEPPQTPKADPAPVISVPPPAAEARDMAKSAAAPSANSANPSTGPAAATAPAKSEVK